MRTVGKLIWCVCAAVVAIVYCALVPLGLLNRAIGRRVWGWE
jgi:hypothetical protein